MCFYLCMPLCMPAVSTTPAISTTVGNVQLDLAQRVLDENRIKQVPELQAFCVSGSNAEKKYAVTLFPNESCSCPATGTCYHLLAAMKSVEMNPKPKRTTVNLSTLAKNRRKLTDGKSKAGRKKPRRADYDINPAVDSIVQTPKTPRQSSPDDMTDSRKRSHDQTPKSAKSTSKPRKRLRFEPNLEMCSPPSELSMVPNESRCDDVPYLSPSESTPNMWLQKYGLTKDDYNVLQKDGEWLSDMLLKPTGTRLRRLSNSADLLVTVVLTNATVA